MRNTSSRRIAVVALSAGLLGALAQRTQGHDHPTREEIEQAKKKGDYQDRLLRIKSYGHDKFGNGLQARAIFKLKKEALKAQGLKPEEISQRLFGGPMPAFPFAAQPELRSSGTVRTLTVLIDFKDLRASTVLPGMTAATIAPNIYGTGTAEAAAFHPFQSVHVYYARASEGKVDLQGDVLGWYNFPKNRGQYEPTASDFASQNQAIFNMVKEALDSFDATHDFTQYDNDNDGDIDLVTVLYTGPDTGWGNFWWAYRWNFFVPEAFTKTFDGKRVNQFVFQFVSRRGAAGTDFDPRTLNHEMGHAFGLADYYDYDNDVGPPGGVGGLDMMDANRGNQNALSRWLLDWIQPEVIGTGAPATKTLVASGSTLPGTKAVAIFPHASNVAAPDGELFIVENRFRVGNDAGLAGMPGNGLLIWHVDARSNTSNNDFLLNNSFSPVKLIRLIRADNANDFAAFEEGSASTYFQPPKTFTPSSTPSSNSNRGAFSGVSVTNLSPPAETMTLSVGILPPPGPVGPPGPRRAYRRRGVEPAP